MLVAEYFHLATSGPLCIHLNVHFYVFREKLSICSREASVMICSMSSTRTLESGLRYIHFNFYQSWRHCLYPHSGSGDSRDQGQDAPEDDLLFLWQTCRGHGRCLSSY